LNTRNKGINIQFPVILKKYNNNSNDNNKDDDEYEDEYDDEDEKKQPERATHQ